MTSLLCLADFFAPNTSISYSSMFLLFQYLVDSPLCTYCFKQFCRQLNMDQAITSSYHHQSNVQVEACIKFVKSTIKKCFDNNYGFDLALLQKRSRPIGAELPSPATLYLTDNKGSVTPYE